MMITIIVVESLVLLFGLSVVLEASTGSAINSIITQTLDKWRSLTISRAAWCNISAGIKWSITNNNIIGIIDSDVIIVPNITDFLHVVFTSNNCAVNSYSIIIS